MDYRGFIYDKSLQLLKENLEEVSIIDLMKASQFALVRSKFIAYSKYTANIKELFTCDDMPIGAGYEASN